MAKNSIQFQQGYSLLELSKDSGSEKQYTKTVFNWQCPWWFQVHQSAGHPAIAS